MGLPDNNTVRLGQRTYSARSLHGQVVHELGQKILSGEIEQGEVLPNETDLGAELEVSRTALREGIKILTAKGLLASRARTGTRVRPSHEWNMLDPDVLAWRFSAGRAREFAQDLCEFRRAIEPMAASLAAQRATPKDIVQIENALLTLDAIAASDEDVMAVGIEPDLKFHQAILMASHNALVASLSALIETALTFGFMYETPDMKMQSVEKRRVVLDAIRTHDSDAAVEAMVALLEVLKINNAQAFDKMEAMSL